MNDSPELLANKTIVLVGLMGAGKTSVGRRLAVRLERDFLDADSEIEEAAGMSVAEIFATHGEAHFRDGERRVIARLLDDRGQILATGGGAFMDPDTRALIKQQAVSVWLKADLEVLFERVSRRTTRPLLNQENSKGVLEGLMNARYPIYAESDITVASDDIPHDAMVERIVAALESYAGDEGRRAT